MNQAEFEEYFFRLQFKLICYDKKGDEFQNFFSSIMGKSDDSFVSVSAAGKFGDKKCDGYSEKTATVFQCYAPDNIEKDHTIKSAITKIKNDYAGAKKHWFIDKKNWMKRWVFVWNGKPKALPADILQAFLTLKNAEKQVEIDNWDTEKLWELIESFSLFHKTDLFGIVPSVDRISETVTEITAAEISVLLEYLAKQDSKEQSDDLELLGISEKLEKNGFSDHIKNLIKICLPMTEDIEGYLSKHPDSEVQDKIADVMIRKYKEFSENSVDSDTIIWQLIRYVQSPKSDSNKHFFAAVGIVAHYFHLCDIFEK